MKIRLTARALKALAADPEAYEHQLVWRQPLCTHTAELDEWAERVDEVCAAPYDTITLVAAHLSDLGGLEFAEGYRAEATRQGWYDPENEKSPRPFCHIYRWWPTENWFSPGSETPYETGVKIAGFGREFAEKCLEYAAHLPC